MSRKKKIGKEEAIAFDIAFPDATKREIKQFVIGAKVLFDIPNTAPEELGKDLAALKTAQMDAKEGVTVATASLDNIEKEEKAMIEAIRDEANKTYKAINEVAKTKTDRITKRTKARVGRLHAKIEIAEDNAYNKTTSIDIKATDARKTAISKENKKKKQAEKIAKDATADVRGLISLLLISIEEQGKKIATLDIIKERFTFNK